MRRSTVPRSRSRLSVAYVAGMTDRFACHCAVTLLDWPIDQLPSGIDR